MGYQYDAAVIGLGPAGMAVSIMASEMGLRVCAIEKHKVGGECMNVGCIPSKALLRMAKIRHSVHKYEAMGLEPQEPTGLRDNFANIQRSLEYISDKKTMGMFKKVDMVYQEGAAQFVDPHTLQVGEKRITAKRIFICTGTQPAIPDIPGLRELDPLTNNSMFALTAIPPRLIVLGSGAIACEMAQAFSRLGSEVTMIFRGRGLLWREGEAVSELLGKTFADEGIRLLPEHNPTRFERGDGGITMHTDGGEQIQADQVLCALGRRLEVGELQLEKAGVVANEQAIQVDAVLRTSQRHIFACGDCNGHALFSHAAMHQGMLALMNAMIPWPFKRQFRSYPVPWTVFTDPQVSHVGMRRSELVERGIRHQVIRINYGDYGAAIAEKIEAGWVEALVSTTGRIYGCTIVGEGSGEMINEWCMAIQNKLRMHHIMLQQHSFPTMGFLSKRASETWMMNLMQGSGLMRWMCRLMY